MSRIEKVERTWIASEPMTVNTLEITGDPNEGTGDNVICVHYFNDGEGVAFGLADQRLTAGASIVLARADVVALYAWLRDHGGFDHD